MKYAMKVIKKGRLTNGQVNNLTESVKVMNEVNILMALRHVSYFGFCFSPTLKENESLLMNVPFPSGYFYLKAHLTEIDLRQFMKI